jgi:hypothetical protein
MSDSPVTRSNSEGSAFSGLFTRVELQRDTNQVYGIRAKTLRHPLLQKRSEFLCTKELGRLFGLRQFIKHLARAVQRAICKARNEAGCSSPKQQLIDTGLDVTFFGKFG